MTKWKHSTQRPSLGTWYVLSTVGCCDHSTFGETEVPRAEIEPRFPEPFCPPQTGAGES